MNLLLVAFTVICLALAVWRFRQRARQRRFLQLASEPLEPGFLEILRRCMPLYQRLPSDLQIRLQGLVNVFLNDKNFFGSGGLAVTDEMRLTVAGNACLLLLNRENPRFPGSRTIILYPEAFVAPEITQDGAVVHEGLSVRLGESWRRGPVILSWADVLRGIDNPGDGHNVVIHEFAHKLDEQNGPMDGLPVLRRHEDYPDWAQIMSREFADLVERAARRRNRVLDEYGATSPAEFFAVASEAFFERGLQMKEQLPDLYAQLERYYGVNPAGWGN